MKTILKKAKKVINEEYKEKVDLPDENFALYEEFQ